MSLNNPQSVRHAEPQPPPIFNFAPTETQYDRGFFGQAPNTTQLQLQEPTNLQMPGSDAGSLPLVSPAQQAAPLGNDGAEMVFDYLPKVELENNFQQL